MPVRPLRQDAIVAELADRIAGLVAPRPRVLLDGAQPTAVGRWAADLAAALELRGRPVLVVDSADFLRPASLRLEHGRTDPDAHLDNRVDTGALQRELLAPTSPGGSGTVLPRWWNTDSDRSARADYVTVPPGGVVLVHGELLLGLPLDADYRVHLHLSPGALARRLPPELHWTLPAWDRYERESRPTESADLTVLLDDPRRPAIAEPS